MNLAESEKNDEAAFIPVLAADKISVQAILVLDAAIDLINIPVPGIGNYRFDVRVVIPLVVHVHTGASILFVDAGADEVFADEVFLGF